MREKASQSAFLRRYLAALGAGLICALGVAGPAAAQDPVSSVTAPVQSTKDPVGDVGSTVSDTVTSTSKGAGDTISTTGQTAGQGVTDAGNTVGKDVGGQAGKVIKSTTSTVGQTVSGTSKAAGDTVTRAGGSAGDTVRDVTGGGDTTPGSPGTGGSGGSRGPQTGPGTRHEPRATHITGPRRRNPGNITGTAVTRSLTSLSSRTRTALIAGLATSPSAVTPAVSSGGTGLPSAADLARSAAAAAQKFAFPLILMVLVIAFVIAQGRADKGDVKLVMAPMSSEQDLLSFQ